jgi:Leucine-rich repeat (LRR) protein
MVDDISERLSFNANINDLFRIDLIKIWYIQIKKIHPEAIFLFENIKEIEIKHDNNSSESLEDVGDTLRAFQSVQVDSNQIEAVNVEASLKDQLSQDEEELARHKELIKTLGPLEDFSLKTLILLTFRQTERLDNLNGLVFSQNWKGLIFLHLNGFNMLSIQSDTFINLSCLRELSLEFNKLDNKSINSNTFTGLKNLAALSLRGNVLTCLPDLIFDKVPNLERLDLSDNKLVTIQSNAFKPLFYLTDLFLSRNQIQTLIVDSFEGLHSLELLDLEGNPVANNLDRLSNIFTKHLVNIQQIRLN